MDFDELLPLLSPCFFLFSLFWLRLNLLINRYYLAEMESEAIIIEHDQSGNHTKMVAKRGVKSEWPYYAEISCAR